LFCDVFHNYE
jgi:hypothetical protein